MTLPHPLPAELRETALDELSVFYVGVTRAKKQVIASASAKRLDLYSNEEECIRYRVSVGLGNYIITIAIEDSSGVEKCNRRYDYYDFIEQVHR